MSLATASSDGPVAGPGGFEGFEGCAAAPAQAASRKLERGSAGTAVSRKPESEPPGSVTDVSSGTWPKGSQKAGKGNIATGTTQMKVAFCSCAVNY